MRFASRMQTFQPNIFNVLKDVKAQRLREGLPVFDLSVGTPDFPPAAHVMRAAGEAALDAANYAYSLADEEELVAAVQRWYLRRYGVSLASGECMSVYGSQEGIAHIALTLCDPGDVVLVPAPCYPIFFMGPYLNGAQVVYYPLLPQNQYLPDLSAISEDVLRRAKMMIVSYPANPVCVTAPDSFYHELIAFAKKWDICIVHDNAYSEIVYDGRNGGSFLAFPGAKEVGVEFNSLSKTYNLTGMRVSFLLGNAELIAKFHTLRSQIDYGLCHIAQKAAIAALDGPQEGVTRQREAYQRRRDALCGGLRSVGWNVPDSQGTMFAWAPLPGKFAGSNAFVLELLRQTGLLCTPGCAFGDLGEGHVRFALVRPEEEIFRMVQSVQQSGILAE